MIFLYNSGTKIPNTEINILGLGDNWAKEDDLSQLENYKEEDKLIVIAHNPDSTLNYTNNIPDLTVSGHTHGGQIRLPWIYKFVIPCEGPFDQGLYQTEKGQVFVTSGLGEVGLPMRFLIPPVIDILELK